MAHSNKQKSIQATTEMRGGPYSHLDTTEPAGQRVERHHLISKQALKATGTPGHTVAPSIQMDIADHMKTRSHGSQGINGQLHRQREIDMIDEGQIGEAFKDEVSTLYEEHGDKYRSGL